MADMIPLGGIEAAIATKHHIGKPAPKGNGKGPSRLVTEAQRGRVKGLVSQALRRGKRAARAKDQGSRPLPEHGLRARLEHEAERYEARAKVLRQAAAMLAP